MSSKRRTRLSAKIGMMTVTSTLCVVLFLGVAFMSIFMLMISQKTKDEMRYFLSSLNQRFDNIVQFVQDSAVSVRHNSLLDSFFHANHFIKPVAEKQLIYSFDLFSARNLTECGAPFVAEAYLFNNKNDCIRNQYFPMTLTAAENKEQHYQQIQLQFKSTDSPYACFPGQEGGQSALCFRLFDGRMRQVGVCVAVIQENSLIELFSEGQKYHNYAWSVTQGNSLLAGQGTFLNAHELTAFPDGYLQSERTLSHAFTGGFQLRSIVAIDRNNVFMVLKPTLIVLALALIVALSVASVVVLALSYRMVRPFKNMAQEIGSFGMESLSKRMEDFPVEEFHEISVAFNKMAERIDRLVNQVYEKKILADQAQIKFLQAQINPHFQFNILTMLSIQAKKAGSMELFSYLNAYAQLIHGKIFRDKEIKIPLRDEMELVHFYLYLQQGRYQKKLEYNVHYGSPEVQDCLIPKLLIEPLVENAVAHGLEPKPGAGRIDVTVFEINSQLHIVVEDNGVGFRSDMVLEKSNPQPGHTGTWLVNTRRLLEILYGENYFMIVQGKENVGTRVEIRLPVERRENHVESHGS